MSIVERFGKRRFQKREIIPATPLLTHVPEWPAFGTLKEPVKIVSPDGNFELFIEEYGGIKFGNQMNRFVSLHTRGTSGSLSQIFSAKESLFPDGSVHYEIRVDAVTDDHPVLLVRQTYYDEQGELHITPGRSGSGYALFLFATHPEISEEERNQLVYKERSVLEERGHWKLTDLPQTIQCRKTVEQFVMQMRKQDFSRPSLLVL